MINLDPSSRPAFDTLLHTSRGTVFPEPFYSFLHNYVSSLNDLPHNPLLSSPSPPTAAPSTIAPSTSGSTLRPSSSLGHNSNAPSQEAAPESLPSESDHRMEKLWADYESVEPYLAPDVPEETQMNVKVEYAMTSTSISKPLQVRHFSHIPESSLIFCRIYFR